MPFNVCYDFYMKSYRFIRYLCYVLKTNHVWKRKEPRQRLTMTCANAARKRLKNEGLKTLYKCYGIGGLIHIPEYIKNPPYLLIDAWCGRIDASWWNNEITKEERELLTDIYYFYHEAY